MKAELERDMKLMSKTSIDQLTRDNFVLSVLALSVLDNTSRVSEF